MCRTQIERSSRPVVLLGLGPAAAAAAAPASAPAQPPAQPPVPALLAAAVPMSDALAAPAAFATLAPPPQPPAPVAAFVLAPEPEAPAAPFAPAAAPLPMAESEEEDDDDEAEAEAEADDEAAGDDRKPPACMSCRRSKVRCEGGEPCNRCVRLHKESACRRCAPERRGRKRKDFRKATSGPIVQEVMSGIRSALDNIGAPKRLKTTALNDDRHEVEFFGALLSKLRSWRAALPGLMEADANAIIRFMYFASYASHTVSEYVNAHRADATDVHVSSMLWLCSVLGKEVNEIINKFPLAALQFDCICRGLAGEVVSAASVGQAYSSLPMGVAVLSLLPRPLCMNNPAWVNPCLASMIGISAADLGRSLTDMRVLKRVIPNMQFCALMSQFWDAIAQRRDSFTTTTVWQHDTGSPVQMTATCTIQYNASGIPQTWVLFLQQSASSSLAASAASAPAALAFRSRNRTGRPSVAHSQPQQPQQQQQQQQTPPLALSTSPTSFDASSPSSEEQHSALWHSESDSFTSDVSPVAPIAPAPRPVALVAPLPQPRQAVVIASAPATAPAFSNADLLSSLGGYEETGIDMVDPSSQLVFKPGMLDLPSSELASELFLF